jgi:hypothetical protein
MIESVNELKVKGAESRKRMKARFEKMAKEAEAHFGKLTEHLGGVKEALERGKKRAKAIAAKAEAAAAVLHAKIDAMAVKAREAGEKAAARGAKLRKQLAAEADEAKEHGAKVLRKLTEGKAATLAAAGKAATHFSSMHKSIDAVEAKLAKLRAAMHAAKVAAAEREATAAAHRHNVDEKLRGIAESEAAEAAHEAHFRAKVKEGVRTISASLADVKHQMAAGDRDLEHKIAEITRVLSTVVSARGGRERRAPRARTKNTRATVTRAAHLAPARPSPSARRSTRCARASPWRRTRAPSCPTSRRR